jgi:hypothetical protein
MLELEAAEKRRKDEIVVQFKLHGTMHKLTMDERHEATGFVYFEDGSKSGGRVVWSIQDGELSLGASWGFPDKDKVRAICDYIALYALARGYYVAAPQMEVTT